MQSAPPATPVEALAWAHPIIQEWFLSRFGSATEPQIEGWPAILAAASDAHFRSHRLRKNPYSFPHLH